MTRSRLNSDNPESTLDHDESAQMQDQEEALAVGARAHSPAVETVQSTTLRSATLPQDEKGDQVTFESSKKNLTHLLTDTPTETLVNLPSGKISKREKRVALKGQTGVSCILYAMRRIAFFNDLDVKHTKLYKCYRQLKEAIINFGSDFESLFSKLSLICSELNIDVAQTIKKASGYNEIEKSLKKIQCSILYEALIKQRFFSLFNFQESGWNPEKGFAGLQESLRKHGAHIFIGKFGAWCHGGRSSLVSLDKENSEGRETFGFAVGSYKGDQSPWTHAIVVDKVKIVDGKEMVYFRDPYDKSDGSAPERVYRLSYENFVARLTNQQSHRYGSQKCQDKEFGIVSKYPGKLI